MAAYKENYHLAMWLTGKRVEGSWAHPNEDMTFYELQAYVDNVMRRVGLQQGKVVRRKSDNDIFAAGITIENRGGSKLAELGILSNKLLKEMDVSQPVYYAEINWNNLMKLIKGNKVLYKEISKYPSVSRDLALLIDKSIEFSQIEDIAKQSEKKLLKKVELFDVYEGKNLPEGKKSYAVNFVLQDESKTLNDKQIDAIMNKIITNLKNKLGAQLR